LSFSNDGIPVAANIYPNEVSRKLLLFTSCDVFTNAINNSNASFQIIGMTLGLQLMITANICLKSNTVPPQKKGE